MRKAQIFSLLILCLIVFASPAYALTSVVATSNTVGSQYLPEQNKIVQDSSGLYWVFYPNTTTTGLFYKYSNDLTTWNSPLQVWSYSITNNYQSPDVHISGNTVYLAQASGAIVYFRIGTISGTVITWGSIRTVEGCNTSCRYASVGYNGSHYAVALVEDQSGGSGYGSYNSFSYDFTSNGGVSWTSGTVDTGSSLLYPKVITMSTGRWMFMYYQANKIVTRLWTGTLGAGVNTNTLSSLAIYTPAVSNGSNTDIIHSVMVDSSGSYNIWYNKYNSGWGVSESVANNTGTVYPMLSFNYGDNSVIVSWWQSNVLKTRTRFLNGTWGAITNQLSQTISDVSSISVSNRDLNGELVYTFMTGAGAPYNITIFSYTLPLAGTYSLSETETMGLTFTMAGGFGSLISNTLGLTFSMPSVTYSAVGGANNTATLGLSFNFQAPGTTTVTSTTTKFTARPIADTATDFWALIGVDSTLGNLLVLAGLLVMIIFLFLIRGATVPFAVLILIFVCLIIVFTGLGLISGWVQIGIILIVVLLFALTVSRRLSNG